MRNSSKAALAAVAGAGLLFGGLGSLAYWEDAETAEGATVTSGTLDLSAPECTSWKNGANDVNLSTFRIVPGDTITRTCDFVVDAAGQSLETELTVDTPSFDDNTLAGELDLDATYARNGGTAADLAAYDNAAPAVTNLADDDTLTVVYTVALPFGTAVDNTSNSGAEFITGKTGVVAGELTAVLSDLTLTATQVNG